MNVDRIAFHNKLVAFLGSSNVYNQPPKSTEMKYPCILYTKTGIDTTFADGIIYKKSTIYEVTIIDNTPDSMLADDFLQTFTYAKFNTAFTVNNLKHDVYIVHTK